MKPTDTVIDEPARDRFVLSEGGADAELHYRAGGDRLVLTHTEVPEAFRGQGVGGRLVEAALDRARRTGETIVPRCSYARRWLEGHADRTSGVHIDFDSSGSDLR